MTGPMIVHLLILSGLLFAIGLVGVITRRNLILILLSLEILLSAANLAFVTFGYAHGNLTGQIVVFFVMIVAAAEVAVGLAVALQLVRHIGKSHADEMKQLRW
jgi:NADH-quinone oxidoreductase subunit K